MKQALSGTFSTSMQMRVFGSVESQGPVCRGSKQMVKKLTTRTQDRRAPSRSHTTSPRPQPPSQHLRRPSRSTYRQLGPPGLRGLAQAVVGRRAGRKGVRAPARRQVFRAQHARRAGGPAAAGLPLLGAGAGTHWLRGRGRSARTRCGGLACGRATTLSLCWTHSRSGTPAPRGGKRTAIAGESGRGCVMVQATARA